MSDNRLKEVESYNRLFILGGKGCSEDTFRSEFGKFGRIKDVFIMKDKQTGDDRGIVYITYEKISDAARAMEEMNGKSIPGNSKPLKVLIANSKGSGRDPKEDEKLLRLFIMIPKSMSESEVQSVFENYGDIEYVRILKDKATGNSKGLAYVKYFKASNAALAFENCDQQYKPVFATNHATKSKDRGSMSDGGSHLSSYSDLSYSGTPRYSSNFNNSFSPAGPSSGHLSPSATVAAMGEFFRGYPAFGDTDVEIQFVGGLSEAQVQAFCDLPPGLEYSHYDRVSGLAYLKYCSAQAAAYAKKKFEKVEYPPGYPIAVRFASENPSRYQSSASNASLGAGSSAIMDMAQSLQKLTSEGQTDFYALAQSIQKAAELLQRSGFNSNSASSSSTRWNTSNLPPVQPVAVRDTPVAERLFFVSQPESFPDNILTDLFCRFGNFIDAYFMPGKNYGYAKFGSKQSAEKAIELLHGHTIYGNRLKVMHAEPPPQDRGDGTNYDSKRPRHD